MLYYKANSNRKAKFQTYVKIEENKRVSKGPLCKESVKHIQTIFDNAKKLAKISQHFDLNYTLENGIVSCDLVNGISLSELLVEALMENKIEQMFQMIKDLFQSMLEILPICDYQKEDTLFGDIIEDPSLHYTNIANLDFNFDNIFMMKDDFKVIDCEWCFDCTIPIEYIQFRSLLYFYTKYQSLLREVISYEELMEYFHIDHIELYQKYEDHFQNHVYGINRRNNYIANWFDENRKKKEIKPSDPFMQLYIDENNGYSESNSMMKAIEDQHLQFHFDLQKNIHGLRVDFCNFEAYIEIHQLYYLVNGKRIDVQLDQCISNGYLLDHYIVYLTNDPQLYIPSIDAFVDCIEIDYTIVSIKGDQNFIELTNQLLNEYQSKMVEKMHHLQHQIDIANYEAKHPLKTMIKKGLK